MLTRNIAKKTVQMTMQRCQRSVSCVGICTATDTVGRRATAGETGGERRTVRIPAPAQYKQQAQTPASLISRLESHGSHRLGPPQPDGDALREARREVPRQAVADPPVRGDARPLQRRLLRAPREADVARLPLELVEVEPQLGVLLRLRRRTTGGRTQQKE